MDCQAVRLLPAQDAARIVSELQLATFSDGKLTASGTAKGVKFNLQLGPEEAGASELDKAVYSAFQKSREFQQYAIPRRILKPMFSRYDPGMHYGAHVDNPLMGGTEGIRSDLSVTLFLSPPDSYDGGELVIERTLGEERIKLDAGEAIVYSSSSIHYVSEVTRGVRYAAVTWVQSAIRDERMRAMVYDLNRTLDLPDVARSPEAQLLLAKIHSNLLRYAAES
jgi:PKHD-type hydroxylase